jgi:hypothetical protein
MKKLSPFFIFLLVKVINIFKMPQLVPFHFINKVFTVIYALFLMERALNEGKSHIYSAILKQTWP